MRNGFSLILVTVSLFLAVGCGAPLPEEMDGSLQGESSSELTSTDPINGIWKSDVWSVDVCPCTNTGKLTAAVGCYQAGTLVWENITRNTEVAGIWYKATRYTGDGTACGLRKTYVDIGINGTMLYEYENGTMLRAWSR